MTAAPLRPGDQLASTVCGTRVVVIRVPADRIPVLACGASPMVAATTVTAASAVGGGAAVTLLGKRYVDATDSVEVLCTAPGSGALSCDGEPMTIKAAKALPASD
ncbi:hypothetical protein [Nocardia rosealba]|uniref:hypothetical protein n=1 Tax=Nocardia rosealba TaxID=2878563 RepID=UPI001CD950E0|nr:hypothetical protein [Nocardia rosealba]MCA2207803.1 hypothetical protein [Nocardia rosealba]